MRWAARARWHIRTADSQVERWHQLASNAGHGCNSVRDPRQLGCSVSVLQEMPKVPGAGVMANADKIGLGVAAVALAGVAAHAAIRTATKGKNKD